MATPSSILAWKITWTEESGGIRVQGSQRVRHNWEHKCAFRNHKLPPVLKPQNNPVRKVNIHLLNVSRISFSLLTHLHSPCTFPSLSAISLNDSSIFYMDSLKIYTFHPHSYYLVNVPLSKSYSYTAFKEKWEWKTTTYDKDFDTDSFRHLFLLKRKQFDNPFEK